MIQEAGNTVLIIEHDMEIAKNTDHIIDIGPGGGSKGGEIVASGKPADIIKSPISITGKYLNREKQLIQVILSKVMKR